MELFDYQKKALEYVRKNKKVYLALSMGMGKTLTSVASCISLSDENILVIAELNEVENSRNFENEVTTHFPEWTFCNLRKMKIEDVPQRKAVCICNIDYLKKLL